MRSFGQRLLARDSPDRCRNIFSVPWGGRLSSRERKTRNSEPEFVWQLGCLVLPYDVEQNVIDPRIQRVAEQHRLVRFAEIRLEREKWHGGFLSLTFEKEKKKRNTRIALTSRSFSRTIVRRAREEFRETTRVCFSFFFFLFFFSRGVITARRYHQITIKHGIRSVSSKTRFT